MLFFGKEVIIMAIRIITDSTCDLSAEDQTRLDIHVVPLTVHFPDASYLDGIEISSEQFYDRLEASETLPTTSQVPPEMFVESFQKYLDAGDEIVGIFISSKISGTYNSACMAKESIASDSLHIVDSGNATLGLALLISEAAKHRDAGFSAAQIAEHVTMLSKKVRLLAALNTLKYLRKGGRISTTTAIIGELVGVKPLMSIIDGTVQGIGKARGMPAAINALLQKALADLPDLRYGVIFAHSCAPDLVKKVIETVKEPLKLNDWLTCNIGSVIGTYTGKGVVGFAYIAR
jgi:DegV family protein with EDD domain